MCLFLQNQRFQELTSRLVNDMAAASADANFTLGAIRGGLAQQAAVLEGAGRQLGELQVWDGAAALGSCTQRGSSASANGRS